MQFDVYLSDPYYTEKVAICYGNAGTHCDMCTGLFFVTVLA